MFDLPDAEATEQLGESLAVHLLNLNYLALRGDLGAGKTTLVRGVLRGLGHKGKVKSPTFTLVEEYSCQDKVIYHFDLYRLNDPEELEAMGIRDYFSEDSLCLIEWPEKAADILPEADLELELQYVEQQRSAVLIPRSEKAKLVCKKFNLNHIKQ